MGSHQHNDIDGDALELVIPPAGMTVLHQLGLLLGAGAPLMCGAMFAVFLATTKMPSEWWPIFGAGLVLFFALPAILVTLGIVRHARTATSVRITPESLAVERPGSLRNKHTAIGIDELEELTIVSGAGLVSTSSGRRPPITLMNLLPSHRIVARSDRASVSFGEGLSTGELEWLKSLVQSAVTA
jgi:hypothetical protein